MKRECSCAAMLSKGTQVGVALNVLAKEISEVKKLLNLIEVEVTRCGPVSDGPNLLGINF